MWTNNITLFLFDHQVIYCKKVGAVCSLLIFFLKSHVSQYSKILENLNMFLLLQDILKRNTYVYKGRVCLNTSEIIDVPDGKGRISLV